MRSSKGSADAWCRSKNGVLALFCAATLVFGASAPGRADVRKAVKKALPATVGVEWYDAADEEKPGKAYPQKPQVAHRNQVRMASGTILSSDGLIATTLEPGAKGHFSVTLNDGRVLDAKLLVDDRRSGLRLLRVEATDLAYVSVAGESAQIGEEVTATYCLDLRDRAAVRGIVAATGRELLGMGSDLLLLEFNSGMMSGGSPLVNDEGDLVGIIAFRRVGAQSALTTYALPASTVRRLLDVPRNEAHVVLQRGLLGIYLDSKGFDDGKVRARLVAGAAAAAAGLHNGDEILTIDGERVGSFRDLSGILSTRVAGQSVHLGVLRDGKAQAIDVTLAAAPPERPTQVESPVTADDGTLPPAPRSITTVRPEAIYVLEPQGRVRALNGKENEASLESLRGLYEKAYRAQIEAGSAQVGDGQVSSPTIMVERSHVEKKLDEISRDVQSLREQMQKLTEELQRLQKQLGDAPPKPQ